MEDVKNEKLIEEMNDFISENDSVTSGTDDGDLPFEPYDAFSTDPVEFEEMAEHMLDRVETLFDLTRVCNRHSEKYLKAFALLERGIRQLGSICVTRAALKEQNDLPGLEQLTTKKLYGMASFNYRKLDSVLSESVHRGNDLYPELTEAFFRCFNLLSRLRATDRKIYNYFRGKCIRKENWAPLAEGYAFSSKSWSKGFTERQDKAASFRSAPAYPVLQERCRNSEFGMKKPEVKNKKSEIRNKKCTFDEQIFETGDQEPDLQNKKSDLQNKKSEIRNKKCMFGEQIFETGDQEPDLQNKKSDLQNKKSEFGNQKSEFGNLKSIFRNRNWEFGEQIFETAIRHAPDATAGGRGEQT